MTGLIRSTVRVLTGATAVAAAAYAAEGSQVIGLEAGRSSIGRAAVVRADISTITPGGEIRHDQAALGLALTRLAAPRTVTPLLVS